MQHIIQFSSPSDPLVPYEEEQMVVHRHLNSELITLEERGHFMEDEFPELLSIILERFGKTIN